MWQIYTSIEVRFGFNIYVGASEVTEELTITKLAVKAIISQNSISETTNALLLTFFYASCYLEESINISAKGPPKRLNSTTIQIIMAFEYFPKIKIDD